MASVAWDAGVGIATLFRRFPTREDLINAVFADRINGYVAAVTEALDDPDPWHGFTTYVHTVCAMQAEDRGFAEVLTTDPDDRRAQLIRLTPAGSAAAARIREVGRSGMQAALAHWSPRELHVFTTLFHRMVDDFLAYDAAHANPKNIADTSPPNREGK